MPSIIERGEVVTGRLAGIIDVIEDVILKHKTVSKTDMKIVLRSLKRLQGDIQKLKKVV